MYVYMSMYVYMNVCMWGAGRSSEVARSLMVRWVVGSILHGVDQLTGVTKAVVCIILSVGWCI